jgi:hypothetical protein
MVAGGCWCQDAGSGNVVAHGESWGSVVGRGKLLVVEKKMLGAKRSQKVLSVAMQRDVAWWKKKQTIPLSNAWRIYTEDMGVLPKCLVEMGEGERIGVWKGGMEATQSLLSTKRVERQTKLPWV